MIHFSRCPSTSLQNENPTSVALMQHSLLPPLPGTPFLLGPEIFFLVAKLSELSPSECSPNHLGRSLVSSAFPVVHDHDVTVKSAFTGFVTRWVMLICDHLFPGLTLYQEAVSWVRTPKLPGCTKPLPRISRPLIPISFSGRKLFFPCEETPKTSRLYSPLRG